MWNKKTSFKETLTFRVPALILTTETSEESGSGNFTEPMFQN